MATKKESKESKAAQQKNAPEAEMAHEQEEKDASKAIAADAGADPTAEIDSLLELLQGDLTEIEPEAALETIEEWYSILHKSKDAELKELSGHLKELKQALKGGKASGHEIGDLLEQIGEQTYDAAGDLEKGLKTPIHRLGKQLSKVGKSLGKAEDQEQIEQIDALVDTLEGGDLSAIETDAALATIDHWYTALHKSEDETLKQIADGLKQLKQTLKGGKADSSKVAEALTELGEQTTQAGGNAAKGFKRPIQRLGKLLSKAGKSLEQK
jgi:ABC-type transporter Mla subunit MlaD